MHKKAGEVVMEYALLIGVAALALAGLRLYFQRGIQSAVRIAADEIGNQDDSVIYDLDKGGLSSSAMRNTTGSRTIIDSRKDGSRGIDLYTESKVLPYEENTPSSTTYTQSE